MQLSLFNHLQHECEFFQMANKWTKSKDCTLKIVYIAILKLKNHALYTQESVSCLTGEGVGI